MLDNLTSPRSQRYEARCQVFQYDECEISRQERSHLENESLRGHATSG